jgi:hypothetical protein
MRSSFLIAFFACELEPLDEPFCLFPIVHKKTLVLVKKLRLQRTSGILEGGMRIRQG